MLFEQRAVVGDMVRRLRVSQRFTFERFLEIGNDLVRLAVCDREEDVFRFSAGFQARLLVQFAKLVYTDNKQLQASLKLLPSFGEKPLRRVLLACWHTLNEYCRLLRAANYQEWLEMEADYLVFCYALLKAIYEKAKKPDTPLCRSARFCRLCRSALPEVFQGFREYATLQEKDARLSLDFALRKYWGKM